MHAGREHSFDTVVTALGDHQRARGHRFEDAVAEGSNAVRHQVDDDTGPAVGLRDLRREIGPEDIVRPVPAGQIPHAQMTPREIGIHAADDAHLEVPWKAQVAVDVRVDAGRAPVDRWMTSRERVDQFGVQQKYVIEEREHAITQQPAPGVLIVVVRDEYRRARERFPTAKQSVGALIISGDGEVDRGELRAQQPRKVRVGFVPRGRPRRYCGRLRGPGVRGCAAIGPETRREISDRAGSRAESSWWRGRRRSPLFAEWSMIYDGAAIGLPSTLDQPSGVT